MSKQSQAWGIHWFRRDLRLAGNEALRENLRRNEGRVLGLFCFDRNFLKRPDFSYNRFAFFLKTLEAVREEMEALGGELLVVDELAVDAFPKLFSYFEKKKVGKPSFVTWGRDYEPFARERDTQIAELLDRQGILYSTMRDHLIQEPGEVLKSEKPGDFYRIYTPYFKKWISHFQTSSVQSRLHEYRNLNANAFQMNWKRFLKDSDFPYEDACLDFKKKNQKHVTIEIPEAGFETAIQELHRFKKILQDYQNKREIPSIRGTSKLSIFFKNGSLTPSYAVKALGLDKNDGKRKDGPTQYLKEIVWREFYYSILFHCPHVEKKSFLPRYEKLAWKNSDAWFERWKEGTTGVPIVDAGMRELLQTGWMHNRVRMIVASFLTKDLLIDWRWGERHFMQYLLDGDLAANNGGWQWAASTGCDPQPYFRVFNPWLQSKKFDPNGDYIRKFIPELRDAPVKVLHLEEADRSAWKYPKPLVNHAIQRKKAIDLFRKS